MMITDLVGGSINVGGSDDDSSVSRTEQMLPATPGARKEFVFIALILLFLAQGCGSESVEVEDPGVGSESCGIHEGELAQIGHAAYVQSCAPTDGPALEILLTPPELPCDSLFALQLHGPSELSSFVQLRLYGSFEPVPMAAHELGSAIDTGFSFSTGGLGRRCLHGECTLVERGSVMFGSTGSETQYLDVRLCFADGTEEAGRFVVHRCEREVLCG